MKEEKNFNSTYQTLITSSTFGRADLLYFRIFVTAAIAFSVGFTFSGSRLFGSDITCTSNGMAWAHVTANCSPPNCRSKNYIY